MLAIVDAVSSFVTVTLSPVLVSILAMLVVLGEWQQDDNDKRVEAVDGRSTHLRRLHLAMIRLDEHVRAEQIVDSGKCRPQVDTMLREVLFLKIFT